MAVIIINTRITTMTMISKYDSSKCLTAWVGGTSETVITSACLRETYSLQKFSLQQQKYVSFKAFDGFLLEMQLFFSQSYEPLDSQQPAENFNCKNSRCYFARLDITVITLCENRNVRSGTIKDFLLPESIAIVGCLRTCLIRSLNRALIIDITWLIQVFYGQMICFGRRVATKSLSGYATCNNGFLISHRGQSSDIPPLTRTLEEMFT